MRTSFLLLFSILIFSHSCKKSQTSYQALAQEKLGEGVEYLSNEEESLMLCSKKTKNLNSPINSIKYFVFDIKKQEILIEDIVENGTIKWFDERRLEIFFVPGMMGAQQTRDDYTFILDVDTKEKVRKTEL